MAWRLPVASVHGCVSTGAGGPDRRRLMAGRKGRQGAIANPGFSIGHCATSLQAGAAQ